MSLGVVERAQVGVDLVGERSRQESETLPRFDRWAAQNDALNLFALQSLHGFRHRQVGFSRSGRADAEHDGVVVHRIDVLRLTEGLGANGFTSRCKDGLPEQLLRAALVAAQNFCRRIDLDLAEVVAVAHHRDEFVDKFLSGFNRRRIARQGDFVTANVHFDVREFAFDDLEKSIVRAKKSHHGDTVYVNRDALALCRTCGLGVTSDQGCLPRGFRRAHERARGKQFDQRFRQC